MRLAIRPLHSFPSLYIGDHKIIIARSHPANRLIMVTARLLQAWAIMGAQGIVFSYR